MIDYYNINSFAEGPLGNPLICNEDNIQCIVTSILFKEKPFYETVFRAVLQYNRPREEHFRAIVARRADNSPEDFYVRPHLCLNHHTLEEAAKARGEDISSVDGLSLKEPYSGCKEKLRELLKSRTPINKMKIILGCSEVMNSEIESFYESTGL